MVVTSDVWFAAAARVPQSVFDPGDQPIRMLYLARRVFENLAGTYNPVPWIEITHDELRSAATAVDPTLAHIVDWADYMWNLLVEATRTVTTASNIPDWHVADSVNLAEYVHDHPQRTVIRIFAREVVVDQSITRLADVVSPPLDLRIDCHTLVIAEANVTLDIGGSDTALGWRTYAPTLSAAPNAGETGFPAGTIVINALSVTNTGYPSLMFRVTGGAGGSGQGGHPGSVGANGYNGIDGETDPPTPVRISAPADLRPVGVPNGIVVVSRGTEPTDGGPGGQGQDGARGGDGGPSGSVTVTARWGDPDYCPVFSLTDGGLPGSPGGAGGTAGAGGPGGLPGRRSYIYPGPTVSSGRWAAASPGRQGPSGAHGPSGNLGSKAVLTLNQESSLDPVYAAMAQDRLPNSLRIRAHLLFNEVLAQWAQSPGTVTHDAVVTRLSWLNDLATAQGFTDIAARFTELQGLTTPSFGQQVLAIPSDALHAGLTSVADTGSSTFATDRPTLAALANTANSAALANEQVLAALGGGGQLGDDETAFYTDLDAIIEAAAGPDPGSEMLATGGLLPTVPGLLGTGSVADAAACESATAVTAETLVATEAMMGPAGLFLAATTFIGFKVLTWYFDSAVHSAQAERHRDIGAAVHRNMDNLLAWQQTMRDADNQAQAKRENARAQQRAGAAKRADDQRQPVVAYGSEFVGALVDLEVAEGGSTGTYAIFDGWLMPRISDPAALAVYLATSSRFLRFLLTVRLPAGTPALTLGDWHVVTLDPAGQPDGTLEPGLTFLRPDISKGIFTLGSVLLPPIGVATASVAAAPTALAAALTWIFQTEEVPVVARTPTPPQSRGQLGAPARVTSLTAYDVGAGTFHVLWGSGTAGQPKPPGAVVDLGGASGTTVSASVLAALTAVSADPSVYVLISHWDQDHYRILDGIAGLAVQRVNPVLGPTFGIRGPVVTGLIEALASQGRAHLSLVGSRVANAVNLLPNVALQPQLSGYVGRILLPANVSLSLTTRMAATAPIWDKNNTEALVVRTDGPTLLMPGDASFSYVVAAAKASLTNIEATHHGSRRSILTAAGRPGGTVGDNDIPRSANPSGAGRVIYCTGHRYGHGAALVSDLYSAAGWATGIETFAGDVGLGVQAVAPEPEPEQQVDVLR